MPEDRRHANPAGRTAPDAPSSRRRIPLPPLHRREPAREAAAEPDPGEFLGAPPAPEPSEAEAAPAEPRRTGSSGAAVLDALVDEIGRDLDRENGRHDPSVPVAHYRVTLACSSLAPPAPQTPGHRRAPAGPKGR